MKLIVVKGTDIEKNPELSIKLMKERQAGNMVLLLSDYCRTKTVELYYRHANMFVVDRGMFAFSGCHSLYHKSLSNEELNWLKEILVDTDCAIYDEVENACGGALKLFENGKWKERPYLLMVDHPSPVVCHSLENTYDIEEAGNQKYALFPKGCDYEAGIAACAEEAGIGKGDIILW